MKTLVQEIEFLREMIKWLHCEYEIIQFGDFYTALYNGTTEKTIEALDKLIKKHQVDKNEQADLLP